MAQKRRAGFFEVDIPAGKQNRARRAESDAGTKRQTEFPPILPKHHVSPWLVAVPKRRKPQPACGSERSGCGYGSSDS
jgi:hypothetical protein